MGAKFSLQVLLIYIQWDVLPHLCTLVTRASPSRLLVIAVLPRRAVGCPAAGRQHCGDTAAVMWDPVCSWHASCFPLGASLRAACVDNWPASLCLFPSSLFKHSRIKIMNKPTWQTWQILTLLMKADLMFPDKLFQRNCLVKYRICQFLHTKPYFY